MQPIKKNPTVIENYSCVTAFGRGVDNFWNACSEGKSFFEKGLLKVSPEITEECIKFTERFKKPELLDRVSQNPLMNWSLASLFECLEESQWGELTERDGLVIATTTGITTTWEGTLMKHCKGEKISTPLYQPVGVFAEEIQNQLGHKGPVQIFSSACAAGSQAVAVAKNWLELGFVDRCIVLGAEELCQLTDWGFRSLSLVNGEDCKPFNENYNNICLSEAAAVLLMSRSENKKYHSVTGTASSSDAYSMTAPNPDGSGPKRSISGALKQAQLKPSDIQWVHAHGTGSLQNDQAEAAALSQLGVSSYVSSTKAVHGHSLAASGVLESILCLESLERQKIIASHKAETKDFNINLATENTELKVTHVLKNSLGFGGINSSLVFSHKDYL